ncbi:DUF2920 family protein [Paenibacillus sp. SI8]|uniref:DUF2920 family protein n=1 Tax=unclassified Paenibacillus TaxID=185978 RepID=UPI003465BAFD
MISTIKHVSIKAHPDIELNYKRDQLEYVLTYPSQGINEETGLIMVITPFGDTPNSIYQTEKLRPHLADNYNCIVAGINFFGIERSPDSIDFDAEYIAELQDHFGIPHTVFIGNGGIRPDFFPVLVSQLKSKGIKRFEEGPITQTIRHTKGEYESFGFLPAIDCLVVLGDILKQHHLNKKKIIAFGSSYGGYIAMLMGKFAPHTFSTVIDNSGFSRISLHNICAKDFKGGPAIYQDDEIFIKGVSNEPWTILNENAPNYFSDSHRSIRSLLEKRHRVKSETNYFIYHSKNDQMCPVGEKEEVANILSDYNQTYFTKVSESDIDGNIFKNLNHGMDASLRGLFELTANNDERNLLKKSQSTDFQLGSVYNFDCGRKAYRISYTTDYQLIAEIIG